MTPFRPRIFRVQTGRSLASGQAGSDAQVPRVRVRVGPNEAGRHCSLRHGDGEWLDASIDQIHTLVGDAVVLSFLDRIIFF